MISEAELKIILKKHEQCCEIYKDGQYEKYRVFEGNYPSLGTVLMSDSCALKLCEMLNDGEIEL